jgi:prophage regulatory protein
MEQAGFLRLDVVLSRSGLSRATLYRKISNGTFPRQISLGERAVGWRSEEFETWCRDPKGYRANV